ncbi:TfoX/Sxy family protein [Amycolatopsis alkalitolerans]|uniref:TfoX/Sxy family protein n=1 Tax=Amycolatopsis alkalitolerans TaxID=2547244 RepID=A0A5C4LRR9_9PSEU|nr:TfoX/Sxy family protein [Amycolatopsis alkalitolerans]TNC21538.1 TfoX/Sxy family protein [Amycolatopsis alkalitolerans]
MAYDRELADRIRALVAPEDGFREQAMFGGLAFLVGGNMAVVASGEGGLMVRMPREECEALIDDVRVHPMTMGSREMRGWLRVDTEAVRSPDELERWVARGVSFARSLPAKARGRR